MSKNAYEHHRGRDIFVKYPKARVKTESVKALVNYAEGTLRDLEVTEGVYLHECMEKWVEVCFLVDRELPFPRRTFTVITESSRLEIAAGPKLYEICNKEFPREIGIVQEVTAGVIILGVNQLRVSRGMRPFTSLELDNHFRDFIKSVGEDLQADASIRGRDITVLSSVDVIDLS